jgi:hypothetical protein
MYRLYPLKELKSVSPEAITNPIASLYLATCTYTPVTRSTPTYPANGGTPGTPVAKRKETPSYCQMPMAIERLKLVLGDHWISPL